MKSVTNGWLTLALLIAISWSGLAWSNQDSLHCGNRIAKKGDPQYYVEEICPQPFWIERWVAPIELFHYSGPPGGHDRSRHGANHEAWYVNFGARKLIRRLVFVNGYLERVESLGRGVGYRPGSRRCSSRELMVAGGSVGEIYAQCGEPDYIYDDDVAFVPYYRGGIALRGGHYVYRTRWIYRFGSRRFDLELVFEDGRLRHVNELKQR